jgi:two-component system OmpR family response regulator
MRIVIIEDNQALARGIAYRLQDIGHATDVLHDGQDADLFLRDDGNDIIILDVNLPRLGGLEVLRNLRARGDGRPVLLVTANAETPERVAGLDAGADDYLVKPFAMEELEARVRALSRRSGSGFSDELTFGPLALSRTHRSARAGKTELDLPRRELAALEVLMLARGRIVAKERLLEGLYGTGPEVDAAAVEVCLSRLRKHLKPHGIEIAVQRGLGYRLLPTESEA